MIIHVAGCPGSGKTFIKNIIDNTHDITTIDTDDWTNDFYKHNKKFNSKKYEKFIQNKVAQLRKKRKPAVIVGVVDYIYNNEYVVVEIDVDYKYFIKINTRQLFIQFNQRLLTHICRNQETTNWWIENKSIIPRFVSFDHLKQEHEKIRKVYLDSGYKEMTQREIIKQILRLLKNV